MSTVLAARPAEFPLAAGPAEFYNFVKLSFAERRKTLWNNLAQHYERDKLSSLFTAVGVSPQARAEQLPPRAFVDLFAALLSSPVTAAKQTLSRD
jgi:16S rRNA A1518/A1519 N6-dimethyltransferase RsmA/KsgA/DIM1 with predicted DNA glycosylase/AP lyase activity